MSSTLVDGVVTHHQGTGLFDVALLVLLLNVGVLAHILLKHNKANGELKQTKKQQQHKGRAKSARLSRKRPREEGCVYRSMC
jgi:hypothetical protein